MNFFSRTRLFRRITKKISSRTVLITGLSLETSPFNLVKFFKDVGRVVDYKFMYDPETGIQKGECYVLFDTERSAKKALLKNSKSLLQRPLRIQLSRVAFGSLRKANAVRSRKICVAYIYNKTCSQILSEVREELKKYGEIVQVDVQKAKKPEYKWAWVEFKDHDSALRAHQEQPMREKGSIIHWA